MARIANEAWTAIANAGIMLEAVDDSWDYRHRYGQGGPFGSREAALHAALLDLFARIDALQPARQGADAADAPPPADPATQPDRIEQAISDAADLI